MEKHKRICKRNRKHAFFKWFLIVSVLILMYIPVIVVAVYSFNSNSSRIPVSFTGFTGAWYKKLFTARNGFGDALKLSLRVALYSVVVSCAVGTLGAVGLYRGGSTRFGRFTENLITLPIMIPEIILGLSLMVIFNSLGFSDNVLRLVLAHITFCIPYVFLNVKSCLTGIDDSLTDAARDLGASRIQVLVDIILPLCRGAILSGAFMALAMSLDDFVISFFVCGSGEGTLPIKIYSSVKVGISPQVNALCTIIMGSVFLIAAAGRYFSTAGERKNSRCGSNSDGVKASLSESTAE